MKAEMEDKEVEMETGEVQRAELEDVAELEEAVEEAVEDMEMEEAVAVDLVEVLEVEEACLDADTTVVQLEASLEMVQKEKVPVEVVQERVVVVVVVVVEDLDTSAET